MEIRDYQPEDAPQLFALLRSEGEDWACYWRDDAAARYERALLECVTFLALQDGELGGFVRCREDAGFGVYVYDLLVAARFRGHAAGRRLMEHVCARYPEQTVYVMSDADGYYETLGYRREGSIFEVAKP